MKKAGIVGAGILGRVLAFMLQEAGWKVCLFDADEGDKNCSMAAAGLLCPWSELDKAEWLIGQMGEKSIQAWPKILRSLPSDVYFKQLGSLVLHHPADSAEWLHYQQRLDAKLGPSNNNLSYQALDAEALQALEPELDKFPIGQFFPHEAQIDCQGLMDAFESYFKKTKTALHWHTRATAIGPNVIKTDTAEHRFDIVFDCRGMGAKGLFKDLYGVRGELIWLHAPEVHLDRPLRLLHPRYSLYIVPRPGQVFLIGASEIMAEDNGPISVQTTLELLSAATYVHPGFLEARILKTISHTRPTLPNHLPRIGYQQGLIAINGLYRHGYLLSPSIARDILRALESNFQAMHYPTLWEKNS